MRLSIFSFVSLPFLFPLLQNSCSLLPCIWIFKIPQVILKAARSERNCLCVCPFLIVLTVSAHVQALITSEHLIYIQYSSHWSLSIWSPTINSSDQVLLPGACSDWLSIFLVENLLTSYCLQIKSELLVPFWLIPTYVLGTSSFIIYLLLLSILISC